MEYPGKLLLDPAGDYDDYKLKDDMLLYDKEKQELKITIDKRTQSKGKLVSLNRREFMRWWSEDFLAYTKDAKETSMLARAQIEISKLLDAIEDVQLTEV